jgi:hypothetical protein
MVAGRSYNTQCTHVPTGASGSSHISAELLVPAGALSQLRGGEIFSPSHVYLDGIGSPSAKLELVILIVIGVLLFSGNTDFSDLEQAVLMAASKIPAEKSKNWPLLTRIDRIAAAGSRSISVARFNF